MTELIMCNKCHLYKPATCFHYEDKKLNKLRGDCTACRVSENKVTYYRHEKMTRLGKTEYDRRKRAKATAQRIKFLEWRKKQNNVASEN